MPAPFASLFARDVTVRFIDTLILESITLTIGPRSRIGVIAPNGTGKTTLLRTLAGLLAPTSGKITMTPPTASVGYLPQEPERSPSETVHQHLGRRAGVTAAEQTMERAATNLAASAPGAADDYSTALEAWLELGGADFDARAKEILADLGLNGDLIELPMAVLSGGQGARVSLAAILLSRFDINLLDEPTNDLDFDGLARLERFVTERRGGLVVVSHDRTFLEHSVETVIEIDEFSKRATQYDGGWQAYVEARDIAKRHAWEAYEQYAGDRDKLATRAQRQREWATQGAARAKKKPSDGDKFIKAHNLAQTEKLASKAAASQRAIDRLDVVEEPRESWELHLMIASAPRSGAVVARLEDAVVERGTFRLGPIDLEIGWAQRVGIVGANGSGKSTLLQALFGRLPLLSGRQWMGPSVVVVWGRALTKFSWSRVFGAFLRSKRRPRATRSDFCTRGRFLAI